MLYSFKNNKLSFCLQDLGKLRNIGLVFVVTLFLSLVGTSLTTFIVTVTPYGWPQRSFIRYTPIKLQSQMYAMAGIVFFLPVIISCIMYGLLFYSIKTKINKVHLQPVSADTGVDFGGIYIGQTSGHQTNPSTDTNSW
jgi:hypothetical protein